MTAASERLPAYELLAERRQATLDRGGHDALGPVRGALGPLSERRCGVLLVGPLSPPPRLGGVENGVALLLASRLAPLVNMDLFNTARTPDPRRRLHRKLAFQLSMYLRFAMTLLRARPRIVHVKTSSGVNFYQNALYVLIARILGRRAILQLHSGHFPSFYRDRSALGRWIVRRALRWPNTLMALSETWARLLEGIRGPGRVSVVPNALDVETFGRTRPDRTRFGIPSGKVAVLFVGTRDRRMDEEKGLSLLVEAFASARAQHPELLLVLAGPACSQRDFSARLGARGDGWLTVGVLSADAKAAIYRSADIFVLPSFAENMPNTLLEAMAAGVPAVATRVGAIPEMITDGADGLLVARGDLRELIDGIVRLAADSALRARLGARAAETVRGRYDLSVLETRLASAYAALAG